MEKEEEVEALKKIGLEEEADPEANFTDSTSLSVTMCASSLSHMARGCYY